MVYIRDETLKDLGLASALQSRHGSKKSDFARNGIAVARARSGKSMVDAKGYQRIYGATEVAPRPRNLQLRRVTRKLLQYNFLAMYVNKGLRSALHMMSRMENVALINERECGAMTCTPTV